MAALREQKWFYILLSILLAVVLWLYIRAEQDPAVSTTYRGIEVQLTGESVLASKGLTVSELQTEKVNVRIQAPASVLGDLNRKNITVTVDVSHLESEGEHSLAYTVDLPTNINTEGIVIQSRNPESVKLTVDKLYTQTLPIEFLHKGSVAKGYQAGTPTIQPENVTISGSVEQVNQVARVVAVLEADDLSERFDGDLPLKLLDKNGSELKDLTVELDTKTAYVLYPIVISREVPLTVDLVAGGGATENDVKVTIEPKTITVSGSKEDVNSLTEYNLGTINLSEVMETESFNFPINLDSSLENVSGADEAKVTVEVKGLSTQTFEVDNISLLNVPKGYKTKTATESRTITVRGTKQDLKKLNSSQMRIVADLKDADGTGTYTVPARVYLDADTGAGVVGTYNIVVSLTK